MGFFIVQQPPSPSNLTKAPISHYITNSVKLYVDKVATMSQWSLNSLTNPFLFGLSSISYIDGHHNWHVQVCIRIQVIFKSPISIRNVAMGVVCGLSGECIDDKKISNNYVVVVVQEVFITNVITIDPLNSYVDNKPRAILFWSSKFLKQDLKGNV